MPVSELPRILQYYFSNRRACANNASILHRLRIGLSLSSDLLAACLLQISTNARQTTTICAELAETVSMRRAAIPVAAHVATRDFAVKQVARVERV